MTDAKVNFLVHTHNKQTNNMTISKARTRWKGNHKIRELNNVYSLSIDNIINILDAEGTINMLITETVWIRFLRDLLNIHDKNK